MIKKEKSSYYDSIVVGSGVSGMTMALLLAMNGKRVLLLEKAGAIGGSLRRFYRQGIPLDTGFHFTGGFSGGNILSEMLTILKIQNEIQPEFVKQGKDNQFIFESDGQSYQFPLGCSALKDALISEFPEEKKGISGYFSRIVNLIDETGVMEIGSILDDRPVQTKDDFVTLADVLDSLTDNTRLKSLLSTLSMCYGSEASAVSFADHSRVVYGLYQSIARVKDGGDAFIRAFEKQFHQYGVTVKTNAYIQSMETITNRSIGEFVLNDGSRIGAEHCIFSIHPKYILETLPAPHLTNAFKKRVAAFERSIGFFSLFLKITDDQLDPFSPALITLLPDDDIGKMFDTSREGDFPLLLIKSHEEVKGEKVNLITAFEMSHYEHVKAWADSSTGNRPAAYDAYKKEKIKRIKTRVLKMFPEYGDHLSLLDASSMLTYRDYLNTPFGCAYGIKQKVGQFNLFGRLPFRNVYSIGQNALLPGIVGAMMSSFILCRMLLDRHSYTDFLTQALNTSTQP